MIRISETGPCHARYRDRKGEYAKYRQKYVERDVQKQREQQERVTQIRRDAQLWTPLEKRRQLKRRTEFNVSLGMTPERARLAALDELKTLGVKL